MPTNLLLLPLLGGYWFLHTFHYTRFKSQRLDGYRLLVKSAFAGVVLVIISRLLVMIVNFSPPLRSGWNAVAPSDIPFLGTASASLLLGFIAPYSLNFLLSKTRSMTVIDAKTAAIERHGNDLLRLLHSASLGEKTVSVSLDNGKVYIGLIAAVPNLSPHDTYLGITPFYSGYREKDTHELVFTVDYLSVYEKEHLHPEDFRVVIPVASICMASLFDHSAYSAFRVESEQASEGESTSASAAAQN